AFSGDEIPASLQREIASTDNDVTEAVGLVGAHIAHLAEVQRVRNDGARCGLRIDFTGTQVAGRPARSATVPEHALRTASERFASLRAAVAAGDLGGAKSLLDRPLDLRGDLEPR